MTLHRIRSAEIRSDLSNLEAVNVVVNYKFGILYMKDGQTQEEEMFNNSKHYGISMH